MKRFCNKHPELWKFIKFNITVIVTSALDIISYLIFLYIVFAKYNTTPLQGNSVLAFLGIKYKGYLFAYFISTTLGYVAAYLMNRKITFHSDINPVYSSVMYILLAVFNIIVSSWIGGIFGSYIKARNLTSPIVEIISKFIIINIPTIWTYPAERYVIQIKKKVKRTPIMIATDLDGTLLASDTNVSGANLNAIKTLSESGVETAILTGRTFYEIPPQLRNCGYIKYFVYSNGAGINEKIKGIVDYTPLPKSQSKEIFDILNKYETFVELYSNGFPFVDAEKFGDEKFEYYKIDSGFVPEMHKSRRPIKDLASLLTDDNYKIEMFDVFFRNQVEREKCKAELLGKYGDIEITTSMDNNLEIMKKGVNKGTGLMRLSKISKIGLENIIVLGDSENDLTAFKAAKRKYAVSNACEKIKSLADKVICSNDEHIMEYMKKELV